MNIEEAVSKLFTVTGSGRYKRTVEHDSLVLDTYANTFYWNSRGFGGDVADFLSTLCNVPYNTAKLISDAPVEVKETPDKQIINQNLYKVLWENGKTKRDFWYTRGFNDAVIDMYYLGYMAGFYTLPCVLNNVLNAVILRTPDKVISEVQGSRISLFGYDQLKSNTVLIVESAMDVPLLRMFGFDAVSHNYGSNVWKKEWSSLFLDKDVYYIPDNDLAGEQAIKRLDFSCKVAAWPKGTPEHFDTGKLYLNNPDKFESNVSYLMQHAVPIEFIKEIKNVKRNRY